MTACIRRNGTIPAASSASRMSRRSIHRAELPTLKIQIAHFGGGIARYLPRILGLQQREKMHTAGIPRHGRQPQMPFDHYLHHRLFYDCCGWSSPDHAAEQGAQWVRTGFAE